MKIDLFADFDKNTFFDGISKQLENEQGEMYLVFIEANRQCQRTDFVGLDYATNLQTNNPIILCSFLEEIHFSKLGFGEKFLGIMGRKNTGFLRLPFTHEELLAKYQEIISSEKEEDPLAIELSRISMYQKTMGQIRHKAEYCFGREDSESKSRVASAIADARDFGLEGKDEEIIEQIKSFKYEPVNSFLAGKFFPGVFVDLEGTLLKNGVVDENVLHRVEDIAGKKPVTLWTGGKISDFTSILISSGISWKLVSKQDFSGASVEIAIDDETELSIKEKYGITIEKFIQI